MMGFCPSNPKWRLWLLSALLAASPAGVFAQQQINDPHDTTEIPLDQQNLFDDRTVIGPDDLGPDPTLVHARPNQGFDILPEFTPDQQKALQDSVDNQMNWSLLTPAEIYDVPTAKKILGITDQNDDQKLTATERYLKRLDDKQAMAVSNAMLLSSRSLFDDDSSRDPTRKDKAKDKDVFSSPDDPTDPKSGKTVLDIWGRAFRVTPDNPDDQRDPIWNSAFSHPPNVPKTDMEQAAEMQRFRILLGSVTPEKPVEPLQPTTPQPDPFMEKLPSFDPAGNNVAPLKETVYRPKGLMPLQQVGRPPPPPPKPPVWTPKLPPWLQQNQTPSAGTQQRVY